MAILEFNITEVEAVIKASKKEIWLAGDQGVYLCSDTDGKNRKIAYAFGCNPKKDEDWWENKRYLFGGDDGGDELSKAGFAKELVWCKKYRKGYDIFCINLTKTQIKRAEPRKSKKTKVVENVKVRNLEKAIRGAFPGVVVDKFLYDLEEISWTKFFDRYDIEGSEEKKFCKETIFKAFEKRMKLETLIKKNYKKHTFEEVTRDIVFLNWGEFYDKYKVSTKEQKVIAHQVLELWD